MYAFLLFLHNTLRWLVLASLLTACWRGFRGWWGHKPFTATDNRIRHITATIAHCQLAVGYILYFNSPVIAYFRAHANEVLPSFSFHFFGIIHIALMTLAIIVVTSGSSAARRQQRDVARFRTMALCCALALLIIFCAIPWPFSPLAQRPYFRNF